MRFRIQDIVPYQPQDVNGVPISPTERLERVVAAAVLAEELGYDSFAVGERHYGDFLSSAPTVLLGAIAAATSRILLSTGVTVLSLLDPVRAAEDYATVDVLSGGRLEIVIGKGNEVEHFPIFGKDGALQYEYLVENYELLRRLLSEEDVTWSGAHRAPLEHVTTSPRPFDGRWRIWHGSATSTDAVELAAKWGDPVFSSHTLQPTVNYKRLLDHYRERWEFYGRDPALAWVGAGSGGLYLAETNEAAVEQYRPVFEANRARASLRDHGANTLGKVSAFATVEEAADTGTALVGTPERVAEKIVRFHDALGHHVQAISANHLLPHEAQHDVLRQFAEEVIPLVNAELGTDLWSAADAGRARGFTAPDQRGRRSAGRGLGVAVTV
ncbi:LLM class flavin-dependent oxidoreductase [Occultella aeris]|uniref:Limonene 1,2-monooxygenase n=1 Tax=Occultella aeris TaxID=2761496 RepID=A0A7M4DF29_9MICO|nr:LLM class flavin-dependent oxidoreductase [Occultella aeris]VZO35522.1 Limonene 1,2-monooxygenase [Occultella aeris]